MHSRGTFRTLSALAAAAVVAFAAARLPAQGADRKLVYVTVADQSTKPVTGLTAPDFAVKEDGTDREVLSVAPASDPGFFILTMDTSTGKATGREQLIERSITDLRNGAAGFIRQVQTANPQSQVALWEHSGAAQELKGFTVKTEDLEKEAKRLVFEADPSVLLEAFADAAKQLQRRQSPRRIIVAFAFDSSPESSQVQPAAIARTVRQSGAQVWAVTLRDRAPASPNRDNVLNGLSQMTGGARMTINAGSAIETVLKQVADLVVNQYELTYARPGGGKPPEQLQINVKKEGVLVAAPQWAPR